MTQGTDLFEVAVYRRSFNDWLTDTQERIERYEEAQVEQRAHLGLEIDRNERIRINSWARWAERVHGWEYNEVIAWIRLIWDGPGPVVKGYMWQVGKEGLSGPELGRRYPRNFLPHPFVGGQPLYKVLEEWFDDGDSDDDIRVRIRDDLCYVVSRKGELPGRHLDLRVFDAISPQMRWRRLVGLRDID